MTIHETMQASVSYLVAFVAGTSTHVSGMSSEEWLQAGAVLLLLARLLQDVPKGIVSAINTYKRIKTWRLKNRN